MGKIACYASLCHDCFIWVNGGYSLDFPVSGGQQWAFMETRANRKETGCSMVCIRFDSLGSLTQCWLIFVNTLFPTSTEFKYGKAPILIATDVASRGLGLFLLCLSFITSYCLLYSSAVSF